MENLNEAPDGPPADVMDTLFAILDVEKENLLCDEPPNDLAVRTDEPWVLSIDDDDNVAIALQIRMEQVGVKFVRAANAQTGYRTAFVEAPRAILLDYEMPDGNGDYTLRRLKESPATRDIPVICLTGRREAFIERQMRGLGAAEFLSKPYEWSELWDCLNRYLGPHQSAFDSADFDREARSELSLA